MNVAEWILVVMLSVTLLIFLIAAIVLIIKLIHLADEAEKIVETGQGIAAKADDIVDNVKGMTSVGGIVKTFANRVIENQERRYAAEDAARAAEEDIEATAAAERAAAAEAASFEAERAERAARHATSSASAARQSVKSAKADAARSTRNAKKSSK